MSQFDSPDRESEDIFKSLDDNPGEYSEEQEVKDDATKGNCDLFAEVLAGMYRDLFPSGVSAEMNLTMLRFITKQGDDDYHVFFRHGPFEVDYEGIQKIGAIQERLGADGKTNFVEETLPASAMTQLCDEEKRSIAPDSVLPRFNDRKRLQQSMRNVIEKKREFYITTKWGDARELSIHEAGHAIYSLADPTLREHLEVIHCVDVGGVTACGKTVFATDKTQKLMARDFCDLAGPVAQVLFANHTIAPAFQERLKNELIVDVIFDEKSAIQANVLQTWYTDMLPIWIHAPSRVITRIYQVKVAPFRTIETRLRAWFQIPDVQEKLHRLAKRLESGEPVSADQAVQIVGGRSELDRLFDLFNPANT